MSNIISSIARRIKAQKYVALRRIKLGARHGMGWTTRPKIGSPRRELRTFYGKRRFQLEEAKRQARKEALGRVGGLFTETKTALPMLVGGTAYLAGRQETKIRRKIRSSRERRAKNVSKSSKVSVADFPKLRRTAKKYYRYGADIGRPVAAGILGYNVGIVSERRRRKKERSATLKFIGDVSTLDILKKKILGWENG